MAVCHVSMCYDNFLSKATNYFFSPASEVRGEKKKKNAGKTVCRYRGPYSPTILKNILCRLAQILYFCIFESNTTSVLHYIQMLLNLETHLEQDKNNGQ